MVSIESVSADDPSTAAALSELSRQVEDFGADTRFLYAFYGCGHDDAAIHHMLRQSFPRAAIIGGTSCGGVMTAAGVGSASSIGLLAIMDDEGSYGVASTSLEGDIAGVARDTLERALARAECPGELPELIWIYQAPGHEEVVLEGLRSVVGDNCPIIGGSSADDDVSGRWRQLGTDGVLTDGLTVAVLFPSGGVGLGFQGGYEPTGKSGIATQVVYDTQAKNGTVTAVGGRYVREIDGEPAAVVYDRWLGGALADKLGKSERQNILADTTIAPLGIESSGSDQAEHFRLVHPEAILPGDGLATFADIAPGTRIHCMQGDRTRLIERAGRVAQKARADLERSDNTLAGGIMVYCAGCRIAVDKDIGQVADAVRESLGPVPFIGCFTFGEQGSVLDRNVHGNLMISAIAFGA